MVWKIDYRRTASDKIIVHSRHSTTTAQYTEECDYVIVTVPLPVIQNFQFKPPLSSFKQEAIRSTRYESSTKVLLKFSEKFWQVDIEKGKPFNRPILDNEEIINGGHDNTTDTASQIVYPTPTNYLFKEDGNKPYIDWDFSDTKHLNDDSKSGILVSYSWGFEATRLAAFDVRNSCTIVLQTICEMHSRHRYPDEKDNDKRKKYYSEIFNLFISGQVQAWQNDEWNGGAFTLFGPNQYADYWQDLINWPQGLLQFDDCISYQDLMDKVEKLKEMNKSNDKILKTIDSILENNETLQFIKKVNNESNKFSMEQLIEKNNDLNISNKMKLLNKPNENVINLFESELKMDKTELELLKDDDKTVNDISNKLLRKVSFEFSVLQDNNIYLCGEALSWCNGWIQGALESSLRATYQLFDNYQIQNHKTYIPAKVAKYSSQNKLQSKENKTKNTAKQLLMQSVGKRSFPLA